MTWSWQTPPSTLEPNQFFEMYLDGHIADDAAPGPVAFQPCLLLPDPDDAYGRQCNLFTDVNDLNGNGDRTDHLCCYSAPSIDVASVGAMESRLQVKGQLDEPFPGEPGEPGDPDTEGFSDGPGRSAPGGSIRYRLHVSNVGNVPLSDLVVTDILPFVGDTGVAIPEPRDSDWLAEVTALTFVDNVITKVSTEENPCRSDMNPSQDSSSSWPSGCTGPNWILSSAYAPQSLLDVRALRFEFNQSSSLNVLYPGDEESFEWPMQVAANAPANGEFAWNSVAFSAAYADDETTRLLPSEPEKVAVQLQPPEPAIFGDYAWIDLANSGNQEDAAPDQGLNDVRVDLYLDDGDKIADPQVDAHQDLKLTHDNDVGERGYYQFSDLVPGDYFARFTPPAGYEIVDPNAPGTDHETDSDADPATGLTEVTTIESGEVDLSWDIGLRPSETGAVGDRVWFDTDADGIQNEPALRGINCVTVELYLATDLATPIASTQTANDINGLPGHFRFSELDADVAHQLRFVLPEGAAFTQQTGADSDVDSDADPVTGFTAPFTPVAGDYDASIDAGILLPSGELSLETGSGSTPTPTASTSPTTARSV